MNTADARLTAALASERALADELGHALALSMTDTERSTPNHKDDVHWRHNTVVPQTRAALSKWRYARSQKEVTS